MNDLIDRQEALDCFHDWIDRRGDVHTANEMPEYQAIEALPSAQHEVTEEEVKEYCRKRCLCIVDSALFKKYASAQPEKRTDKRTETHACDLISRQAAIEIIKNYCENGCDYAEDNWCPSCQREKFVELLKALPSAQPEIIRCKDCRHRIVNDHYGEKGYLNIKGYCELDTGDPFELGRNAENDDWFCADAERRTDE